MFNFEQQFGGHAARLVMLEKQSLQQKQRDVYESHRHRVFAISYYMTGDEITAEKVMTDSFIRAFQQTPEPDGELLDQSLVAELKTQVDLTPATPAQHDPADVLTRRNVLRTDMEEALQQLPAQEKLAFLLRDVEGYPPEKAAPLLELDIPAFNRLLLSARIRMRQALVQLEKEKADAA